MNTDIDKAKEILRQGELRIKGIIDFSDGLDNKAFKMLGYAVTLLTAFVFYILKFNPAEKFLYPSLFAIVCLVFIILFLLSASKPRRYKGVGIPLQDFENNYNLQEIITNKVIKRYTARFEHNKKLNKIKGKSLHKALLLFAVINDFILLCV